MRQFTSRVLGSCEPFLRFQYPVEANDSAEAQIVDFALHRTSHFSTDTGNQALTVHKPAIYRDVRGLELLAVLKHRVS